jgi:peptidoglycan/xylan/chitin deacetylase (PgdA/CDA1 family)
MSSLTFDRRRLLGGLVTAMTAFGAPAALARTGRWPDAAPGAVSLTYDDGLDSQIDVVAPELERRGWRGTFYITEENMAVRTADWADLARRGHELADHTETHPCSLGRFDAASYRTRELEPMEQFLRTNFPGRGPATFAYPCGYLGLGHGTRHARYARYQRAVRGEFVAARTTSGGPNNPRLVRAERFHLHAFEPTYDADSLGPAIRYLRETRERGAWSILIFHAVLPERLDEGDTTIATHAAILDLIARAGFWCAPVGQVLEKLGVA